MVLEKTLETLLDCKEIQPVNPKGNQSWIFIGSTDAEAETPILWPPDAKNLLISKDPDARKDWRWEEKGITEDEMVWWHHWFNEHEVWVSFGSWWWTGRPGVLQSMESQILGHEWATELNWESSHEDCDFSVSVSGGPLIKCTVWWFAPLELFNSLGTHTFRFSYMKTTAFQILSLIIV